MPNITAKINLIWGGDPLVIEYEINDIGNELHFNVSYLGNASIAGSNKKCKLIYKVGAGKVLGKMPLVFDASENTLSLDVFWDQTMIIKLEDMISLKNHGGKCRCHKFVLSNSLNDNTQESFDFLIKNGATTIAGADPGLVALREKIKIDYKDKALLSINDLVSDPLGKGSLSIERITLRATLRKGLKLLKEPLYKVNTNEDTTFTISLLNDGVWLESRPLLKIDAFFGVPNAYLRSIFFDFKTGKVEKVNIRSDNRGLLFFGGKKVEKQVQKAVHNSFEEMLKGTLLDPDSTGNLLPYNPFQDKNFRTNLAKLQEEILQNLAGGNEESPVKVGDVLGFSLGGNVVFEKEFIHDLGPASILIPGETKISSTVIVKTKLADVLEKPLLTKIDRIELVSEGIALAAKGAVQAMFKKIDILHGGLVKAREVEIHNKMVKNVKLGLVLVKLMLISASARLGSTIPTSHASEAVLVNSIQTAALEMAFKEFLLMAVNQNYALAKSYGIDLKDALGLQKD